MIFTAIALISAFLPLIVVGLTIEFDRKHHAPRASKVTHKAIPYAVAIYLTTSMICWANNGINVSAIAVALYLGTIMMHYKVLNATADHTEVRASTEVSYFMSEPATRWLRRSTAMLILSAMIALSLVLPDQN